MSDIRDTIARQIGQLVLANIELVAQAEALKAENAALKKTQSEGKARAEAMLAEGNGDEPASGS